MDQMFEPKRLRSMISTDAMHPRCHGMHGMSECQVHGNAQMFVAACPCKSGSGEHIDETLENFIQDFGAPDAMMVDGAKSKTQRGSAFASRLRRSRIDPVICNPHGPNTNPCETVAQEL